MEDIITRQEEVDGSFETLRQDFETFVERFCDLVNCLEDGDAKDHVEEMMDMANSLLDSFKDHADEVQKLSKFTQLFNPFEQEYDI